MTDSIAPTPQVDWMQAIVDKLRGGARKLGQVNPLMGAIASDLVEQPARGAENWSYGDKLLGPTNAPMVNSRTEDMLSALPLGAAQSGASKATLMLPALLRKKSVLELNKKIIGLHSTDTSRFNTPNGQVLPELYNPSFSLNHTDRFAPIGEEMSNLMLVHKPGALDPRIADSQIFSHDAVSRDWRAGMGHVGTLQERAGGRLADRAYREDPKALGVYPNSSFLDFLQDPHGAARLTTMNPAPRTPQTFSPSAYAELKAAGPVGVHSGNFSGAILDKDMLEDLSATQIELLTKQLRQRGIPLVQGNVPEFADIANWLQQKSIK